MQDSSSACPAEAHLDIILFTDIHWRRERLGQGTGPDPVLQM